MIAISNSRYKPKKQGGTLPPPVVESESERENIPPIFMGSTAPATKKYNNSEVLLTGQVSIGLAPDRNCISAPGHMTLRFERVTRNVCLLFHGSAFGGAVPLPITQA